MLSVVGVLFASWSYAQRLDVPASVGIDPYHPAEPSTYRIFAGAGANVGLFAEAPILEFGTASVRRGSDLFTAAIISNRSSGGFPRSSFTEFDLLYGYAYEYEIANQSNPPT